MNPGRLQILKVIINVLKLILEKSTCNNNNFTNIVKWIKETFVYFEPHGLWTPLIDGKFCATLVLRNWFLISITANNASLSVKVSCKLLC